MKKNRNLLIIAILALTACTKHSGDIEAAADNGPAASLTLTLPAANTVYHNGDTVRFTGQALSTETIHGYEVYIRRAGDTANLYYQHVHDHNDTLSINCWWVNDRTSATDLEGTVVLALDHDGHTLKKTIPFKAQ